MATVTANFPQWLVKLARRIMALEPGRYQLVLTIDKDGCDCTVVPMGKIERLGR